MDTITHGIAGALLAKAVFKGEDIFPPLPVTRRRVITWSLTLGAIFPDCDVLRDFISSNPMLMITWHRSITHSLLCLPLWAVLLAALTRAVCRWRKWESPSYVALWAFWAIGILSHIFLDLVTTFGTMIWSPYQWSRPAWDILFIIDFSFTAILLIPQLLAWAYEDPEHSRRRALIMWLVFTPAPFIISRIAEQIGAPISNNAVVLATVLFAALFLLPAARGWGHRLQFVTWNRAGLVLAVAYLASAAWLHHQALERIQKIAATENIEVQSIAALPFPPSLWHWDGLIRAPRGVYEVRMDLSDFLSSSSAASGDPASSPAIVHTYYPDAATNSFIEKARALPDVQKFFWFARFPVTRFHKEGSEAVVEFLDVRFPQIRRDRPPSFEYRVRFNAGGEVLSQGWVKK
jgi:membrane-bound metal-dependent hydrolase YbcI (DUF457 family)